MNGANEAAVQRFLQGEIGFNDIPRLVEKALSKVPVIYRPSLADILEADRMARQACCKAHSAIKELWEWYIS